MGYVRPLWWREDLCNSLLPLASRKIASKDPTPLRTNHCSLLVLKISDDECNDAYLEVSEASPTPFAPPTFLQLENVHTEVRASVLCRWGSTPGATAKAHTHARYLLGHGRVHTILEGGGGSTAVLTGLAGGTVSGS